MAKNDRYLYITVRHNKDATALQDFQLFCDIYAATGRCVSTVALPKTFHGRRLFSIRPVAYIPLNSANKRDLQHDADIEITL